MYVKRQNFTPEQAKLLFIHIHSGESDKNISRSHITTKEKEEILFFVIYIMYISNTVKPKIIIIFFI